MDSILQAAEKEPPLSDLDDERAARIARNQQMLQTLGVGTACWPAATVWRTEYLHVHTHRFLQLRMD